jgi:hypothetical protein
MNGSFGEVISIYRGILRDAGVCANTGRATAPTSAAAIRTFLRVAFIVEPLDRQAQQKNARSSRTITAKYARHLVETVELRIYVPCPLYSEIHGDAKPANRFRKTLADRPSDAGGCGNVQR